MFEIDPNSQILYIQGSLLCETREMSGKIFGESSTTKEGREIFCPWMRSFGTIFGVLMLLTKKYAVMSIKQVPRSSVFEEQSILCLLLYSKKPSTSSLMALNFFANDNVGAKAWK